MLRAIRERRLDERLFLDWEDFITAGAGLFVWEAFVSAEAKGTSHVDDAEIAIAAFERALPDPVAASAITAERPLSLIGAAAQWSGWLETPSALHCAPIVIRA